MASSFGILAFILLIVGRRFDAFADNRYMLFLGSSPIMLLYTAGLLVVFLFRRNFTGAALALLFLPPIILAALIWLFYCALGHTEHFN
jgi:hypothetical protein